MKILSNLKKILIVFFLTVIVLPVLFVSSVILIDSLIHPNEVPSFFGWKPFIVLTDSMEDTIISGDVAIVKEVDPTTLKVNDIIAFKIDENTIVTHRIIELVESNGIKGYKTKGDNNTSVDEWIVKPDEVEGIYHCRIAGLGNIALFLQTPKGMLICLAIPVTLLFIVQLYDDMKYKREIKKQEELLKTRIEELEVENEKLSTKSKK